MKHKFKNQKGQALVTLLIFILVAVSIAVAATLIVASNSLAATNLQEGIITKQMADSGVETAYLQILRNPGYVGETITGLNGGNVVVSVAWVGTTGTIVSTATNGTFVKRVESVVTNSQNVLIPISWNDI